MWLSCSEGQMCRGRAASPSFRGQGGMPGCMGLSQLLGTLTGCFSFSPVQQCPGRAGCWGCKSCSDLPSHPHFLGCAVPSSGLAPIPSAGWGEE